MVTLIVITNISVVIMPQNSLPRLIFTITTGRSGTGYLTRVLSCFPGVQAAHEPEPRFHQWLRQALDNPGAAKEFWIRRKLPAIRQSPKPIYAETSHLFGKGFLEPLIELGIIPDLILLHRDHREVASSLYRLNTIPGRTEKGKSYYISPDDPVFLPVSEWRHLHDYQLCYWYCLEMEQRRKHYGERIRSLGGKVADISLIRLSSAEGVAQMAKALELPSQGLMRRVKLRRILGKPVNTKSHRKGPSLSQREMQRLENALREQISLQPET